MLANSLFIKKAQEQLYDLKSRPNHAFREYVQQGLIPDGFKTKEAFFEAVKAEMNTKKISVTKALNNLSGGKYEGIPLAYTKSGSSRLGNREVKDVFFDQRAFSEKIPPQVKTWFQQLEADGKVPAGTLDKYQKYITKGNKRNQDVAKRLSELTGTKFDKGHVISLFNGGSNDPAAQIAELMKENRSKGSVDNMLNHAADELDIPKHWWDSATEFALKETGAPTKSGLPRNQFGKTLSDSEISNVSRHGANPDQVIHSKWKKVYDAIDEASIAKANNKTPEFVLKYQDKFRGNKGQYLQSFGTGKPNVNQQILGIKKGLPSKALKVTGRALNNPVVKGAIGLVPIAGFGIDASAATLDWNNAVNNPSVENFGKAIGSTAVAADQFTPGGFVGNSINAVVRDQTQEGGSSHKNSTWNEGQLGIGTMLKDQQRLRDNAVLATL